MFRHKFNARSEVTEDGFFSSQKELKYWRQLKLAIKSGELVMVLRQVPFHLPGGIKYVCDFQEFWKNGDIRFVEIKGFMTPAAKNKLKQVESLYPVKILVL